MTRVLALRQAARMAVAAVGLCALAPSVPAYAADAVPDAASPTPGADQIQFAAREHDLGYRAYVEKRYAEAASHFENAFFAAPNPAELRSAIRARRDAGEIARAATLAAIGQRRFPADVATTRVASDAIAQARPYVYEVHLTSSAEYSVAIDEKIVAADRVRDSLLFVNPGTHGLVVSWSDGRNEQVAIDATEGGTQSIHLEPPLPPPVPVATTPVATPGPMSTWSARPAAKPLEPALFVTGVALTAVSAGVTVWSGIDTWNNPGKETVKDKCRGLYDRCPEYQEGLRNQQRTNVLVGVTAGLAAATAVVGLFFTQWSRPPAASGSSVVLTVGLGQAGIGGLF